MQGNSETSHTLPGCHMEKHQEQKQPPNVSKDTQKFSPPAVETQ